MAIKRRALKAPRPGSGPVHLFFKLEGDQVAESPAEAKWQHVATAGLYRGYARGAMPFEFTEEIFNQVVANIRNHPQYKKGASGYGEVDLVQWDFNHSSEQDPTEGDLPIKGSPAVGWTRDFEVRKGADGVAQLWALTRFLEPLRSYVKNGQYKWASVAMSFDAVDPVSAKNVGAIVTSIAATNTPFLEMLSPLAASRRGGANAIETRYYRGDMAEGPEDAFEMVRGMLDMQATAGVEDVQAELAKLEAWAMGSVEAPPGVEVDELVGNLRCILNLPTLADAASVFGEVKKLLDAVAAALIGPTSTPAPPDAVIGTRKKEPTMSLKVIASKLGVKEDVDAIADAVEQIVTLRKAIVDALKINANSSEARIGEELRIRLEAGDDAITRLGSLLKSIGVESYKDATGRIADIMQKSGQLAQLMPELEQLRGFKQKTEEAQQTADVSSALASHFGGDETHREVVALYRKQVTREEFVKKYPPKSESEKLLTQQIAGGNGGDGPNNGQPTQVNAGGGNAGAKIINLAVYRGRNRTEKLMEYVRANVPGAEKWTHDQIWEAACSLGADKNVKVEGV